MDRRSCSNDIPLANGSPHRSSSQAGLGNNRPKHRVACQRCHG